MTSEKINELLGKYSIEYYKDIGERAGQKGELVTFLDIDEDGRLDLIM